MGRMFFQTGDSNLSSPGGGEFLPGFVEEKKPPDPPGTAPDPAPLLQVLWVAALTCGFLSEALLNDTDVGFFFRSRVTKRRTSRASFLASLGFHVAPLFLGITGCCNRVFPRCMLEHELKLLSALWRHCFFVFLVIQRQ